MATEAEVLKVAQALSALRVEGKKLEAEEDELQKQVNKVHAARLAIGEQEQAAEKQLVLMAGQMEKPKDPSVVPEEPPEVVEEEAEIPAPKESWGKPHQSGRQKRKG